MGDEEERRGGGEGREGEEEEEREGEDRREKERREKERRGERWFALRIRSEENWERGAGRLHLEKKKIT